MARHATTGSGAQDWRIYLRLLGYARTLKLFFAFAVIGYVTEAVAMGGLAEVLDRIIDTIQKGAADERWSLAGVIVGIVLLRGIAVTIGDLALAHVSFSIVHRIRCELFDRLLALPASYFDRTAQGHLVSRLTFNVAQLRDTTTEALKTLLEEGALVVGLTGYLLYKNWKLTLVFFVIAPLIGWVMDYAGKRFRRLSRRIQDSMGDVTHVASETVSGSRVVRVFGGSAYERERFHGVSEYNRAQNLKMAITKAASTQTVQVFTAIAVAVLVILVFEPSIMKGMDTGAIIAYITATGVMLKPIKKLTEINAILQRGLAAAEDVFAQLDEPLEVDRGTHQVARVQGRVEFRDVGFAYDGGAAPSLDGVSFGPRPGRLRPQSQLSSSSRKRSRAASQPGQTQFSGRSAKAVPAGTWPIGSPSVGSYTCQQTPHSNMASGLAATSRPVRSKEPSGNFISVVQRALDRHDPFVQPDDGLIVVFLGRQGHGRNIHDLDRIQDQLFHVVEVLHPPHVRQGRRRDAAIAEAARKHGERDAPQLLVEPGEVVGRRRQQRQVDHLRRPADPPHARQAADLVVQRRRIHQLRRRHGSGCRWQFPRQSHGAQGQGEGAGLDVVDALAADAPDAGEGGFLGTQLAGREHADFTLAQQLVDLGAHRRRIVEQREAHHLHRREGRLAQRRQQLLEEIQRRPGDLGRRVEFGQRRAEGMHIVGHVQRHQYLVDRLRAGADAGFEGDHGNRKGHHVVALS